MIKKHTTALVLGLLAGTSLSATAAPNGDWFTDAAISPDGDTVLVAYKGDIYRVSSKGGTAVPLTVNAAWDGHPVWSKDGKQIAFASDRNGNLDIYVMPAEGGEATRLTHHSADDIPHDFTPDGKAVTFSSTRTDSAASSGFPRGALSELYSVSTSGGTPKMELTTPAFEAQWNKDGSKLLYREEKALESDLRKHDNSAFARDIWLYDSEAGTHKQLTNHVGGDHNPVWGKGDTIFYTSDEADDTFNVWKLDLGSLEQNQITKFTKHPVRDLTRAKDGTLAFLHHGTVYTTGEKGKPKALDININVDGHGVDAKTIPVSNNVSEFAVSPNGKEIAFVARGEVFVTSTEFKTTKRITDTPTQERSVDFHPDGDRLVYAAERDGKWKLMEAKIRNEDEKYFFAGTLIDEKVLFDADNEAFQPKYSPDGKKVAFLSGRDSLKVLDIESGEAVKVLGPEHNYSYADGDITFDWSPDSKWLTIDFIARKRIFITNVAIVPADGSAAPVDISLSGYQDGGPKWHAGGEAVLWFSSRYGQRDHGSWGREFDVMASFLNQDAYDRFRMSKEEYQLMKELEEDAKKKKEEEEKKAKEAEGEEGEEGEKAEDEKADAKEADKKDEKKDDTKPVEIEWDGMQDRTVRLTVHSSNLADAVLTKDADKLYYLSQFEGGYDLWMQDLRENETKLLSKLNADNATIELSKDEKALFVLAGGQISKFELNGGGANRKGVSLSASMELNGKAERDYFFEHIWRQVKDKFYTADMHGVDWADMKVEYGTKLENVGNNRDFARMMEEMLGELNASHTGAYFIGGRGGDATASLGLLFDLSAPLGALVVEEVLEKGPFDKAKSDVEAGMKLVAVDGTDLGESVNLYALLNHKAGERTRVTFEKADGTRFDEVIKPISGGAKNQLMYERWVKRSRALVESLSDGKVGYVHVRGMNDSSYREVYSDLMGRNFDKDSVVVDTRWNGGGWLHNDLAKLLSGEQYLKMEVRGREFEGDPLDQWYKPSIVVMGEGNYSDAHAFPYTYKALDIGETVGMPVPGTMTAVWWEVLHSGDIVFGIPQVGQRDMDGNYLENQQLEPDHRVKNMPEEVAKGLDKQLEKAVEVLLEGEQE